jgi:hypothetical protein
LEGFRLPFFKKKIKKMAIVDKGIKIELSEAIIPDDYTAPEYVEVSDYEYKRTYQLSVLKATVENATKATTFGNIIDNATIGILKQILDVITDDFKQFAKK